MPIPKNKKELLNAINDSYTNLSLDCKNIPEKLTRIKEIDGNIKGTKISACDTVAYLIGWGKLVLKWYDKKSKNKPVDFPETGYKWNELGLLAQQFHSEYKDWAYKDLLKEFDRTTQKILKLVHGLDNKQLYKTNWYTKWTLGRMIQLNTSSPMQNVRKKIRRFIRENL